MKKRTLLLACLLAGFAVAASAAPYVILKGGRKIDGTRIRATPDGTIILTTAAGNQEIPAGRYEKAVADKPAELDAALRAVQGQKWDEAIPALEKIAKAYRYLDWDLVAQKYLAEAQMKKGDAEAAVRTYAALIAASEEEKNNVDTQWGYRKALLAAKQYAALTRQLDIVVASGSRIEAAKAQNMRGEIELQQNNLEAALLEFLRTDLLFADCKDPQVLGEACFRAAQVLEKLRDPRANDMYRKVASEYRSCSFANEAASKAR